ncbi:hypothetical protein ACI65C_001887 [Semiaphis heraclei]
MYAAMSPLVLVLSLLLTATDRVQPALDGGSAVVQPEADATATGVWSKFGLVVQKNVAGQSTPHTTETSGIIMRVPNPPSPDTSPPLASTPVAPTALGKSWTQISVTHPPPRLPSSHPPTKSTTTTTAKSAVATSTQDVRRDIPFSTSYALTVDQVELTTKNPNYGDEKPAIVKKKRRRKKKGKKHKPFKVKDFKKLKKFMLPLLLAYKLKFFTLVPLMLGGLVLIVATTGFAGFFFALFAVGLGLKGHH